MINGTASRRYELGHISSTPSFPSIGIGRGVHMDVRGCRSGRIKPDRRGPSAVDFTIFIGLRDLEEQVLLWSFKNQSRQSTGILSGLYFELVYRLRDRSADVT